MYKMFLLAYKIVSETRNETCENTDDTIFSHELLLLHLQPKVKPKIRNYHPIHD